MIPKEILEFSVTENLNRYDDMEMILLKGHLVLEQVLYQFLASNQLDMDRIEKMNLMFGRSLELSMAIGGRFIQRHYDNLKEINRIRNKVAHELFFDDYHADLKKWASDVLDFTPKTLNTKRTYKNHVIKAFALLAGYIMGASDALSVIKGSNQSVLDNA